MSTNLVTDLRAAKTLGETLRRIGYSEDAVVELLGDDAYSLDADSAAVGERRLPPTPLARVVRALFLQLPVPTPDAVRSLGRKGVDALEAIGLAEISDDVVPRGRVLPIGKLLVTSDDVMGDDDRARAPDYVAAYTPTSQILDSLTPRGRVDRALDVGTGSGVQALLAARHARHVVATDVNPRALAFTQLNAALNGLTNVECREGSLFEPVVGERFDLVTCNAPYVVSPENRLAYRDGGLEADELSERVVRTAANHLDDAGFAALLVSWVARDEDDPDERPLQWTEGIGCDSWILPVWGADPLDHAATWNDHLEGHGDALSSALDDWTDYLRRLGVRWVSEGAILLHKRAGRHHAARVDELDDDALEEAGDQVEHAFESRARLAELTRPADLLDATLSLATPLRLERELEPNGGKDAETFIEVAEGTGLSVETTAAGLELVAALDGGKQLRDAVQATAERLGLSDAEKRRLEREALDVTRELLEIGALRFA